MIQKMFSLTDMADQNLWLIMKTGTEIQDKQLLRAPIRFFQQEGQSRAHESVITLQTLNSLLIE
jgi:hypothetical protein